MQRKEMTRKEWEARAAHMLAHADKLTAKADALAAEPASDDSGRISLRTASGIVSLRMQAARARDDARVFAKYAQERPE